MFRQLTLLVVLAAVTVCAQVPARGVVRSKSNITNNIVAEADGRLRCLTPDGKACSTQDVQELMATINTSHSNIKNLALISRWNYPLPNHRRQILHSGPRDRAKCGDSPQL